VKGLLYCRNTWTDVPKNTTARFTEFLLPAKVPIAGFGREFSESTSAPVESLALCVQI
jgi:hypothetical protein